MKGRSTTSQMVQVVNSLEKVLNNSGQVDMTYLDFSKAFDSVSHRLLTHKLQKYGIHGNLLSWFTSYLSDRRQRVLIEGQSSPWLPVLSGVPQGSILGPALFLLYINDMPNVLNSDTEMALYADDSKCFRQIRSVSDCMKLQSDLDSLFRWSTVWKMTFSAPKCTVVSVTRKRKKIVFDYKINNQSLAHVSEMKDLGVLLCENLSWNRHIDTITAKANKTMGMIKRTCGYNANPSMTKKLYLTLVRCKLEYSSQTWSVQTKRNLTLIEAVQRRSTKYILGRLDSQDYKQRLESLDILPLSYRREILDIKFLFKAFQSEIDIDIMNYITIARNSTREGIDGTKLQLPTFKTESYAHSYFIRIVPIWNQLPTDLRAEDNISSFHRNLPNFYKSKFSQHFQCDSTCSWVSKCRCTKCRPCF